MSLLEVQAVGLETEVLEEKKQEVGDSQECSRRDSQAPKRNRVISA